MRSTFACLVACLSLAPGTAAAQPAEPGTVSATGSATLERPPAVMRMRVDVMFKAGTVEEALAGLKVQTAAAREAAVKLGASEESIRVESPRIASEKNDEQRQLERMMRERMARAGRNRKTAEVAVPVMVSATMTAEWVLAGLGPDELLAKVHPLQESIREADLAGAKAAGKLSPEQEELVEEMQQEYGSYYGGNDSAPGEPTFAFVAPISDAEREAALAEAFAKAKAEASRLAKAAGATLGPVRGLSGAARPGVGNSPYDSYEAYEYATAYAALGAAGGAAGGAGEDPSEAVAADPGPVKYTLTVEASFALGE